MTRPRHRDGSAPAAAGTDPDDVLTTGRVAAVLRMAARTASKLIDAGRLPGHKAGADRRVRRADLWDFIRREKLPAEYLVAAGCVAPPLAVGCPDLAAPGWLLADGPAAAAVLVCRHRPAAVVVDAGIGRAAAFELREAVRSVGPCRVCLVLGEDGSGGTPDGWDAVLRRPLDPAAARAAVENRP